MDSVANIAATVTVEGFSFRTTFSEAPAGAGFDGSLVLAPSDLGTGRLVLEVPAEFEITRSLREVIRRAAPLWDRR